MDQRSVFFDDWLNSLREQYKYVIRQDDQVALPSLTTVMLEAGFDEGDLVALRADVGVPAAETVTATEADNETETEVEPPQAIESDEVAEAADEPEASAPEDSEDAPLTFDEGIALSVPDESGETEDAEASEDAIDPAEESAQMSMF